MKVSLADAELSNRVWTAECEVCFGECGPGEVDDVRHYGFVDFCVVDFEALIFTLGDLFDADGLSYLS